MQSWFEALLTHQMIAKVSLLGMGFDLLGGCFLAYDLLGGRHGPLRTLARAAGYVALFFVGYLTVLGLRYASVAATGMGVLLALEYRVAADGTAPKRTQRSSLLFAFLRGVVLGLASLTIASLKFGIFFGLLSAVGLGTVYLVGFAPKADYRTQASLDISGRKLLASLLRAIAVSAAAILAGLLSSPGGPSMLFGLKLGLAAGTVSALVGLFSPVIEWWIEQLPERRLGVIGLAMIFVGMVLQSAQYWVAAFDLTVR